jgi:hypothetical protein
VFGIGFGQVNPGEKITLGGIAWFNNGTVVAGSKETILCIEAKVGFAAVFVKPVATETVIRQDRPNVPIEIDGGLGRGGGRIGFACCVMSPETKAQNSQTEDA